jgi:hypothetical protein
VSPAERLRPLEGARAGYVPTVGAWADHLRAGGTTPWLDFCSTRQPVLARPGPPAGADAAQQASLPPAAQLELVRRLAVHADRSAGAAGTASFAALADQVLARPAPGRGAADRPPTWPDDPSAPDARRGAPPVDPSLLRTGELLRLGAGVVADLLAGSRPQGRAHRSPARAVGTRLVAWTRARRGPTYRVVGAPTRATELRQALAASGHPEGGRLADGVVLVAVDSVDSMLADAWRMRVERGSRTRWRTFVGSWAARGRLPSSASLDEVAASCARLVGPGRVHVVADASAEVAAAVLGLRAGHLPAARPGGPLSPVATDVVRRVNAVLQVHLPRRERPAAVRRLVRVLREQAPRPDDGLRVPDRHRQWAATAGESLARRLAEADYPVHGDLGVLRRPGGGLPGPRADAALETMLDAVLVLGGVMPPDPRPQGGRR